jgi:lysophospholipase-3
VKALKVFAAGDDLGAYVLPSKTLRGEQRTSPSTAWLLPSKLFWNDTEVLITVENNKNYTRKDLKYFFNDIDFDDGYEMVKDTENLLGALEHPGVEIHCLHGSGVSTVEKMTYKDVGHFPDKPTLENGNGDGTVNIRSLRGCLRWKTDDITQFVKQPQSFKFKKKWKMKKAAAMGSKPEVFHSEFAGVDHMAILSDPNVLSYIKNAVYTINQG